jgi:hypothetical protein
MITAVFKEKGTTRVGNIHLNEDDTKRLMIFLAQALGEEWRQRSQGDPAP